MKAYKYPEYKTPVIMCDRVTALGVGNVNRDLARTANRMETENVFIVYTEEL